MFAKRIIFCLFFLYTLHFTLYTPHCFSEEIVFQEIIVKDGDTLWGVANYFLKDPLRWPEILRHNMLPTSDPNVILPGMKLKVPVLLIKEHLRAAYLVNLLNRVDYRRKKETAWKKANLKMELYQDDGVRTLSASTAEIKFPTGELVHLHENSLIILRPEEKKEEVSLLAGELRASKTKIITSAAIVEPKISPRGINPEFRTKLKEDKTTLVAVYKGEVDVTAQGKTVTIPEGFGSEIKFQTEPSLPIPLPALEAKMEMKVPLAKALPPEGKVEPQAIEISPVTQKFSLDIRLPKEEKEKVTPEPTTPKVEQYHLQIAKNKNFTDLVIDEVDILTEKVDLKRNLPDGEYYWRIAWVNNLGFEGKFSEPQNFILDTQAPSLQLHFPLEDEEITGEFVYAKGKTEKGTRILVNEKLVPVDEEGNFETSLLFESGKHTITVSAEDDAGNRNMLSRTIEKITPQEKIHREKSKIMGIRFTPGIIGLAVLSFSVIVFVLWTVITV